MLQGTHETEMNINCVDPLGRSALLMAIDNENLEMVELLIEHKVDTKDALLHAISEEFVEAVEVLLEHEESLHRNGEPHVSSFHLCELLSIGQSVGTSFSEAQTRLIEITEMNVLRSYFTFLFVKYY